MAQRTVVDVLRQVGMAPRFRFRNGPTDQILFWDNTTVIHLLDRGPADLAQLTGNGMSVVVADPEAAAATAIKQLHHAGFTAECIPAAATGLPPNHLVVVASSAFLEWVLVFRLHNLCIQRPVFVPIHED